MDRLAEIRERVEKASEGPWDNGPCGELDCPYDMVTNDTDDIAHCKLIADASFIAHAREDIPYLLGLVDRYRKALEEIVNGGCGQGMMDDGSDSCTLVFPNRRERWCHSCIAADALKEDSNA